MMVLLVVLLGGYGVTYGVTWRQYLYTTTILMQTLAVRQLQKCMCTFCSMIDSVPSLSLARMIKKRAGSKFLLFLRAAALSKSCAGQYAALDCRATIRI